MTSGWGLRCSNDFNSGCSQPDVLQGIESDTTIVCPVDAVVEPSKFCVNAPSGKASCNVSARKNARINQRFDAASLIIRLTSIRLYWARK